MVHGKGDQIAFDIGQASSGHLDVLALNEGGLRGDVGFFVFEVLTEASPEADLVLDVRRATQVDGARVSVRSLGTRVRSEPPPVSFSSRIEGGVSLRKAEAFRGASMAPATLRAYAGAWRAFAKWCEERGASPLPASAGAVAAYLADRASPDAGRPLKAASVWMHAAAIGKAHEVAGFANPAADERVRDVITGIRRTLGTAPRQKRALTVEDVRRLVAAVDDGVRGLRDRALVLVGFAAALRRSEIVALEAGHVTETASGLEVRLIRSKTDQEGRGRLLGVCFGSDPATCPVRALRAWRDAAGIGEGPLFRPVLGGEVRDAALRPYAVARILKVLARRAGMDPSGIAGHSLRAGHATEAARNGASTLAIRRQTGHSSDAMLARYVRVGTLFEDNSSARLGL